METDTIQPWYVISMVRCRLDELLSLSDLLLKYISVSDLDEFAELRVFLHCEDAGKILWQTQRPLQPATFGQGEDEVIPLFQAVEHGVCRVEGRNQGPNHWMKKKRFFLAEELDWSCFARQPQQYWEIDGLIRRARHGCQWWYHVLDRRRRRLCRFLPIENKGWMLLIVGRGVNEEDGEDSETHGLFCQNMSSFFSLSGFFQQSMIAMGCNWNRPTSSAAARPFLPIRWRTTDDEEELEEMFLPLPPPSAVSALALETFFQRGAATSTCWTEKFQPEDLFIPCERESLQFQVEKGESVCLYSLSDLTN